MLIKVTFRATFIALCTMLSAGAYAIADAPRRVDIPAGELSVALLKLSKQYGADLVYRPEQVYGLKTRGAHGSLTTEQAVTQLLQGTVLELRTDQSGAMLIAPPASGSAQATGSAPQASIAPSQDASDASKEGKKSSSGQFRVAQLDQGKGSGASSVGQQSSTSQSSMAPSVGLEEIVVTAQKREERLIDVPISIAAVSADELAKRNVTNLDDLALVVPGLAVQDTGQNIRITLRGVSNVGAGNSSQVGMYLDEADVTSEASTQIDLGAYDLQRVEVLRGPQGTLYGEGSAGGTIRFIANDPALDKFEMRADLTSLFTAGGAATQRITEVLNAPLIANQLAIRVSGMFDHEGGWIDQPAAGSTNINDQNKTDVRAKALWEPEQQFTLSAMAVVHRNTEVPTAGEDANGNYTQVFNLTTTPRIEDDYNLYNVTLSYDVGVAKLLSTTSYLTQNNSLYNSGEFLTLSPPPATPYSYYDPYFDKRTETFSDELRLASNGPSPWQWTVGAFFRRLQFDQFSPPAYFGVTGPPGTLLPPANTGVYSVTGSSKAWSLFADSSYKLMDRLTLGAGIRTYRDDETNTAGVAQEATFHSNDPRFYAQFKITDDANIYASAAKGFRSGGFNSPGQPTFGPEAVWTYELGSKTLMAQRRLSVHADIFYTNYTNFILFGLPPPPAIPYAFYQNGGNVVIKGAEWDITWRPVDEWTFSVNGDYLNTRFTSVRLIASSAAVAVGDPVGDVPKYQATASVERAFNVSDKSGFARLDYNLQGQERARNFGLGPDFFAESDIIRMLNFNTGLQWNDSLTLGVFAQNLLNERGYLNDAYLISSAAVRPRPRAYGINASVKF